MFFKDSFHRLKAIIQNARAFAERLTFLMGGKDSSKGFKRKQQNIHFQEHVVKWTKQSVTVLLFIYPVPLAF